MYEDYLDKNEEVLWQGKPNGFIYATGGSASIPIIIFMIFWTAIVAFINVGFDPVGQMAVNREFNFFSLFPKLFFLVPIFVLVIIPIYRYIESKKVEYVVTDKRVYIVSGIIGTDIQSIEYREIQKLNVNVSILERIKNLGTVQLTPDISYGSGEHRNVRLGHRFIAIEQPYKVYKLIKNNSLDVYTDQMYPNEFRPTTNPGYNTKLKK